MCCGITYLVFGVIRLKYSFSSLKPRTLVTEHKVISLSRVTLYHYQNQKETGFYGGGGWKMREKLMDVMV
jgi:hypothetical protein